MTRLTKLYIKNFAIINEIEIDFKPGFTVITGETGAGKSIIINALNLTLGEQADISMIRSGAKNALIKCEIELDDSSYIEEFLVDNDIPLNGELIIKRKLYKAGHSKAWINGKKVNIGDLKIPGNHLIDLHGQHHHQALLNEDNHLPYLDSYGDYNELVEKVRQAWQKLINLVERKEILTEKHQTLQEKKDLWQFQYDEIEKVAPKEGEYEKLKREKSLLQNAEKIFRLASGLVSQLYESENSFYNNLDEAIDKLDELNDIQGEFGDYLEQLSDVKYLLQDLSTSLTDFSDSVDINPDRLESVNERLYSLEKLMKKYGETLEEVIAYKDKIEKELDKDEGLKFEIEKIDQKIDSAQKKYSQLALQLSEARRKWAKKFANELDQVLARLGIKGAQFEVKIEQKKSSEGYAMIEGESYLADENGIDQVRFLISTNPGEPLMPLTNIVSGGEVSRIMLAIKSILAEKDRIPILIFDEIDTGISGKVGRIVGEEVKKLSNSHQILCITHLGQIAGLGDDHLAVRKISTGNRNQTKIFRLNYEERINEIATLIGGRNITDSAKAQAQELLNQ
ncbi:MAG: DNA repair protein RecN [Candidatus Marinimicrobia bacterium]|nr:DNA repair protein RecN [Candidatus Neomarinimicrobiota bacterium]